MSLTIAAFVLAVGGGTLMTASAQASADRVDDPPKQHEYVHVDELPVVVSSPSPTYPAEARRQGIEGTVLIEVFVGKNGRVEDTHITRSIPLLDEAAVYCVKQWTFEPAKANGEPAGVWLAVPIRFRLKELTPPARDTISTPASAPPAEPDRDPAVVPTPPPQSSAASPPRRMKRVHAEFYDLVESLRAEGVHAPSDDDALLREKIIRQSKGLEPRPEIDPKLRERLHAATHPAEDADPDSLFRELATLSQEAPWWAAPYREIATLQEKRGRFDDAAVSLELYLIAAPEADDWESARKQIRHLRDMLESQ